MTTEDGEGEPGGFSPEQIAAAGRRAGRSLRNIAVALYGAANVDAEWTADGWVRARIRRLVRGAADGTGRGLPARR